MSLIGRDAADPEVIRYHPDSSEVIYRDGATPWVYGTAVTNRREALEAIRAYLKDMRDEATRLRGHVDDLLGIKFEAIGDPELRFVLMEVMHQYDATKRRSHALAHCYAIFSAAADDGGRAKP